MPNSPLYLQADEYLQRIAPRITEVRRELHQFPELSGEERKTTAYLSKRLKNMGLAHEVGTDGRGIFSAIIGRETPAAPVVGLRADIDALPITEENAVPYRSKNAGLMHACGHDAHAAMLLAAVDSLSRLKTLPVGWRAVFQPSEEMGHGAREMVRRGALKGVDAIVALHVDPLLPVGQVGIRPGHQTAACQDFTITVRGRGGHGARPHNTIDPIAVSAQLITLIYQAIPRQTDARDPVVVTIGQIEGGHASNIIPDSVFLNGTIRALDSQVCANAREILLRLCKGTAANFGAKIEPQFSEALPGVVNDSSVTAVCQAAASELLGAKNVITEGRPSMGAEDFADYLTEVPGCMIRLGVKRPGKKVTPLHTPTFDIDENALLVGARLLARIVLRWTPELYP